jgi:hypothetical protein
MARIVTVDIDMATGDAEVDLEGFNGKGCGAIQEAFAKALGEAEVVTHKPEFHKPCTTTNKNPLLNR